MLRSSADPDTTLTHRFVPAVYPATEHEALKQPAVEQASRLPEPKAAVATTNAKPRNNHTADAKLEKAELPAPPPPTFETRPTTVRFVLPTGPHNVEIPRIVVHPATRTEGLLQGVSEKLEVSDKRGGHPYIPYSVQCVLDKNRREWKSDCVEQKRPFRRNSLSGLTMIKCPRLPKKLSGAKVKGWVGQQCCMRALVV